RPPGCPAVPYTTLFRSEGREAHRERLLAQCRHTAGLVALGLGDQPAPGEMAAGGDMELGIEAHQRQAGRERLVGYRRREADIARSEEHTSELQSRENLV